MLIHGRIVVLLTVLWAIGCEGGSSGQPTVPVTGVVTFNDQPVEGAVVVFGAASEQERGATGITDSAGRFHLTTYAKDDGAIEGNFTVAISKTERKGGMTADEEHEAISAGKEVTPAEIIDHLPTKYKDGKQSGLTAEVTAGAANDFEFKLTD